jgi:hypothetical protein
MNNHHTKFEVPKPKRSLVSDLKPFLPTRSMWPWPYKVNVTLTFDLKFNGSNLLAKTNELTKFEGQRLLACQVNDPKPFSPTMSMWPWPLDPKINRSPHTDHEQSAYQIKSSQA